MWHEIERYVPSFPDAVLSAVDNSGYPVSVRCRPRLDAHREVLLLDTDPFIGGVEGPASMLFHTHDERLVKMRSCVLRGSLREEGDRWCFQPSSFIPGQGLGLFRGYVRLLRQGRANSRRYLARRRLTAPAVPWEEIRALMRRARAEDDGAGARRKI
ncbi:MAG: hypothetical protein ACR2MA_12575 [Egibacteraceae bacterium]